MIDLTPLDVRKKRGDFRKVLRGYDADEVDGFIEMVAERLEELVKENLTLRERVDRLQDQVSHQEDREEAVREALVTAQELRRDMRRQARKEAELLRREAEGEIEKILGEAQRRLTERRDALEEVERMRLRFLKSFRALLEREMDAVEVEEGRKPLEDTPLEIDFTVKDLEARADDEDDEDDEENDGLEAHGPAPGEAGDPPGPEGGSGRARPDSGAGMGPGGPDGTVRSVSEAAGASAAGDVSDISEVAEVGDPENAPDVEDAEALWLSSLLEEDEAEEGPARDREGGADG